MPLAMFSLLLSSALFHFALRALGVDQSIWTTAGGVAVCVSVSLSVQHGLPASQMLGHEWAEQLGGQQVTLSMIVR